MIGSAAILSTARSGQTLVCLDECYLPVFRWFFCHLGQGALGSSGPSGHEKPPGSGAAGRLNVSDYRTSMTAGRG